MTIPLLSNDQNDLAPVRSRRTAELHGTRLNYTDADNEQALQLIFLGQTELAS